jgi:hypothetical protein
VFHHTTAIFRQVNKDNPHTHHDALEFPDGQMVLLNDLFEGQRATVLQARWRWLCKFFLDAVSMNARPLLQGVFFCDIQWKGLFSRPGRKVQSLQTNAGFECTEVAPTSPSDRAVVHPVSSPIRCVMIRSLPAGAGRCQFLREFLETLIDDLATKCGRPAHDHWTISAIRTAYKRLLACNDCTFSRY